VCKLSLLFRSVGHRVKTHKFTPVIVIELGDIDYVTLTHGEHNTFTPRTLMMDVTLVTHDDYGCSGQRTNGTITYRVSSTGAPQSDGVLKNVVRINIRHHRRINTPPKDGGDLKDFYHNWTNSILQQLKRKLQTHFW